MSGLAGGKGRRCAVDGRWLYSFTFVHCWFFFFIVIEWAGCVSKCAGSKHSIHGSVYRLCVCLKKIPLRVRSGLHHIRSFALYRSSPMPWMDSGFTQLFTAMNTCLNIYIIVLSRPPIFQEVRILQS